MSQTEYKFVSYTRSITLEQIEHYLSENWAGWDVVSHSHSPWGMTILLRKMKE